MKESWTDRTLGEFAHSVALRDPVPGSGCVAAAVGALGAGLASMAIRSAHCEDAEARASTLAAEMQALLAAVDEDARAYAAYRAATTPAERARSFEKALEVPREIAAAALRALVRLAETLPHLRTALRCEGYAAAAALRAAVEGASITAEANLAALESTAARVELSETLARTRERAQSLAHGIQETLAPSAR